MFSNNIINRALLSDTEIMQLIEAASGIKQNSTRQLSQRARMGEHIASVKGAGSDFA